MWKLVFKHRKSVKGEKYDWNENNTRLFVYIACLHSIAFRYSNFDIQMHSRKILWAKKTPLNCNFSGFLLYFQHLIRVSKKNEKKQKIKGNKIQITFNRHWVYRVWWNKPCRSEINVHEKDHHDVIWKLLQLFCQLL